MRSYSSTTISLDFHHFLCYTTPNKGLFMKSKEFNSLFKKQAPLKYQADAVKPYKAKADSFIVENVEESLKAFDGNRFQMIIVAAARTRDLNRGAIPLIPTNSKSAVTALLEIAAGKVKLNYTHKTRN